jgi:hypothetical protein
MSWSHLSVGPLALDVALEPHFGVLGQDLRVELGAHVADLLLPLRHFFLDLVVLRLERREQGLSRGRFGGDALDVDDRDLRGPGRDSRRLTEGGGDGGEAQSQHHPSGHLGHFSWIHDSRLLE